MNEKKFEEVMNFAIDRELEAAKFYADMAKKTKFPAIAVVFKELEEMELGHAEILRNLSVDNINEFSPVEIQNIGLSESMEAPVTESTLTYQDALVIAIKREESSRDLYNTIASEITDETTKKIFLRLAAEEEKHKLQLESIYDEEIFKEN